MFSFLPYVVKSLWRHRTRSLLTISGAAVALLVFCFIGAVQRGLSALTESSEAGRTLVVFQENRFCPQSSRIPEDYSRTIAKQAGVADVVPIKVFTNNCRASLDAIVFQGFTPDQLRKWRTFDIKSGSWDAFARQGDGALVGKAVAARRKLTSGDKFTIGEVTVQVAGVFTAKNAAEEALIYTHLDFLQRARGQQDIGTVTQLEVHLAEQADPDRVAADIDERFHAGPVATTTRTKGMFQADTLADLAELIGFIHWLGYACVGLVLSLVATTTVMSVQDRIKEHAVLQTLGVRPWRVLRLVMLESTLLSTLGGGLGVLGGLLLLAWSGMAIAAEGVTIAFRPSMEIAVQGLVASLAVGVLAGFAHRLERSPHGDCSGIATRIMQRSATSVFRRHGKVHKARMPVMKKRKIHFVLAVVTACGCQTMRKIPSRLPPPADVATTVTKPASSDSGVRPVALQQPLLEPNNLQTPTVSPAIGELPSATASTTGQLSLKDLEQLALGNNPTLAQAEARVAALRGRWVQVGLPPNPSAGYMASEIGNEGKAGQQGGYVGQEFITAGKLGLNRAVVSQEIQRAEQEMAAVQMRVQTDVRKAYYAALLAQRRNDLAADLLRVSTRAAEASLELFNVAGEIPRPALLQTQIEQQNAAIFVQTAEQERLASRRQLSAVVGADLTSAQLSGDITQLPTLLNWDEQLARITSTSPEMASAFANIARARTALQRARVEPIPDVATQFIVQRDNATEDTIAGVQVGMPLPVWNRNQGGIRQAEAEIVEARRNADRVELDLKRRLAIAFETYSTAHAQAEIYTTQILPKSQETFNLVQRGYTLGELGYLDYLSAQRTYSQANLAYLEALSRLWASWNEIEGLLLSDSLSAGQLTQ